ncbi:MAG: hypothetical protein EOO09_13470 [Chitinophagaceae bacterium]|nr:MAG: hypothetical protein EOO09_13470 [Chitinophagaceae bacterium]
MSAQQFEEILGRYLKGLASPEEIRLVDHWYQSFDDSAAVNDGLLPAGNDGLLPADLQRSMAAGLAEIRAVIAETPAIKETGLVTAGSPKNPG